MKLSNTISLPKYVKVGMALSPNGKEYLKAYVKMLNDRNKNYKKYDNLANMSLEQMTK